METYRIKPTKCPACKTPLNRSTDTGLIGEKRGPQPGDATICFGCGAWLIFTKKLKLRLMSTGDYIDADEETVKALETAQEAWETSRRRRG